MPKDRSSRAPFPDPRVRPRWHRGRNALVAGAMLSFSVAATSSFLDAGVSDASSHREAPLIAGDPRADNTDTYAFVSPDKPDTVTLSANWIPFQEPNGGPNFYPFATDAHYKINVDNDGDGKRRCHLHLDLHRHVSRRHRPVPLQHGSGEQADDTNLNFYQTYELTLTTGGDTKSLVKDAIVAPSNVGTASMPNYAALRQQAIKPLPDGGQDLRRPGRRLLLPRPAGLRPPLRGDLK